MERLVGEIARDVWAGTGPGFSERVYHNAFEVELRLRGLAYETERILPVTYKGHNIGNQRADLIIQGQYIVELKAQTKIKDEFVVQLNNYLGLTGLEAGCVVNFSATGPVLEFVNLNQNRAFGSSTDLCIDESTGHEEPRPWPGQHGATPPELFLPPWPQSAFDSIP